jgi:cob(I)alamin adenosyltransferase
MKIYTKTGDKGETGLYDGSRVLKSDCLIESLGNIDELNCEIGLIISNMMFENDDNINKIIQKTYYNDELELLKKIQNWLFEMGSIIAYPDKKDCDDIVFDKNEVNSRMLEVEIDKMTTELPKLTNFILPGGNVLVSIIHKARAVCRRAERSVVEISVDNKYIKNNCIKFINRFSDYLFTLARYMAFINNVPEVIYKKNVL